MKEYEDIVSEVEAAQRCVLNVARWLILRYIGLTLKLFSLLIHSLMLSRLASLRENVFHTSDCESEPNGAPATLDALSMLEQSNFRMVVSIAGAVRDAASVVWSSFRVGGAAIEDHCDALRQIEIESDFVRASALGSIEAFSENLSTSSLCLASSTTRQIPLQGPISKSTALTNSIEIVHGWIQEGYDLLSPTSKLGIYFESATDTGKSKQSSYVKHISRGQPSEKLHETEGSTLAGAVLPYQSEKQATTFGLPSLFCSSMEQVVHFLLCCLYLKFEFYPFYTELWAGEKIFVFKRICGTESCWKQNNKQRQVFGLKWMCNFRCTKQTFTFWS